MPSTPYLLGLSALSLGLVLAASVWARSPQPPPPAPDPQQVEAALQHAPLLFIQNAGQFAEGARFQVRGGHATLWLAEDALWITVLAPHPSLLSAAERGEGSPPSGGRGEG